MLETVRIYNTPKRSEEYESYDGVLLLRKVRLYHGDETVELEADYMLDLLHKLYFPDETTIKSMGKPNPKDQKGHITQRIDPLVRTFGKIKHKARGGKRRVSQSKSRLGKIIHRKKRVAKTTLRNKNASKLGKRIGN